MRDILKKCEINIICNQSKEENKYIKPFIEFYLCSHFPTIDKVDIICPDEKNRQQKVPDYLLLHPKIAIEIKRVLSEKSAKTIHSTFKNAERLQKALDEIKIKEKSVLNASIYLECPWNSRIKKGKEKSIAQKIIDKIIDAIKNKQQEFVINGIGKFKILAQKNSIEPKVILYSFSQIGPFEPDQFVYQIIKDKIPEANKKLGNIKAETKILLLVNKEPLNFFGPDEKPIILNIYERALSYLYNDLLTYENIDEIWLQIERKGKFSHYLLYKSLNKLNFKSQDEIYLLEKWFHLLELGDEYKDKLFVLLKQGLKDKKPYEVFKDSSIGEQIVRLGFWLAEKGRLEDVVWVIEKLIDDPGLKELEGKLYYQYHQQIIKGEMPRDILTTVLSRLTVLLIVKLACHKNYISKALYYTKKLLSHKNLYVKFLALDPLLCISVNRNLLKGYGKKQREGEYKEFHEIVFSLLTLVKENPNYKAFAIKLCNILKYYCTDLSTKEAEQVLDILKVVDKVAWLFVYFAIKFKSKKFEKKLKEIIKSDKEEYQQLKEKIG